MKRTVVAAGVAAAMSMTAVLAPLASAASMQYVTSDDINGWTWQQPQADTKNGGVVSLSDQYGAPEGYGSSALRLETPDGSSKAQAVTAAEKGTMLRDFSGVEYYAYRSSESTGSAVQVAAVNVAVDVNGLDQPGGYTNLVFEPVYQPDQGPLVNDTWQKWIGDSDNIWWSSNPIAGAPNRDTFVTLDSIKAANPDAVVLGYEINQGSGNPGIISAVDGFVADGKAYNFEQKSPRVTSKDQCKDDGWKTLATVDGKKFKNQGQCVSTIASGKAEVIAKQD